MAQMHLKFDTDRNMDIPYGEHFEATNNISTASSVNEAVTSLQLKALFQVIMEEAIEEGATDILITPEANAGLVKLRLDNKMVPYRKIHKGAMQGLLTYMYKYANLNPEEALMPIANITGHFTYTKDNITYACRPAFSPTINGKMADVRLQNPKTVTMGISDLHLPEPIEFNLRKILQFKEGLVVFTGATGSGKTTTEYAAMVQLLKDSDYTKNIMTIESPVEYPTPGIVQQEVNEPLGFTFANALQAILRENPDVILVGEINDEQTAKTAVRAASSGHLVFTTVHANNTLEVSNALNQLGISDRELGNSLRLVIYQTLQENLCPNCRKITLVTPEELTWLDNNLLQQGRVTVVYEKNPDGCEQCNYKGNLGRVMLAEMAVTGVAYRAAREKTSDAYGTNYDKLKTELLKTDSLYYPLEYSVYEKLQQGNISYDDATRLIGR